MSCPSYFQGADADLCNNSWKYMVSFHTWNLKAHVCYSFSCLLLINVITINYTSYLL